MLYRLLSELRRQKRAYVFGILLAAVFIVGKTYYYDGGEEWAEGTGRRVEAGEKKLSPIVESPVAAVCTQIYPPEPYVNVQSNDLYRAQQFEGFSPPSHGNAQPILASGVGDGILRVFVVPHSHTDPGWLETYTQYQRQTNAELDNMLVFMCNNTRMTFQWSEMAFLSKWWSTLDEGERGEVRRLVDRGQFEPVTGSWTMTDEANPNYYASIDNIIEGFQFLDSSLHFHPSTMWTNDPFGYGSTVSYLFKLADVNHTIIHRVHSAVKSAMFRRKAVPFFWKQVFDNVKSAPVLTHMLEGAHYDILNTCGAGMAVCCQFDFKRMTHFGCPGPKPVAITEENLANKYTTLINHDLCDRASTLHLAYTKLGTRYTLPVVLVMLGDDFRFNDMEEWHQQHDNYVKLFDYINGKEEWKMNVKFGTQGEYFKAVEGLAPRLPTLAGDFFPYNDAGGDYWVGYYTSRPFLKRRERILQERIYACDTLLGWALGGGRLTKGQREYIANSLTDARRNLALFQHHDAITGTSKLPVMKDYAQRLFDSILAMDEGMSLALTAVHLPQRMAKLNFTTDARIVLMEVAQKFDQPLLQMPIVGAEKESIVHVLVYNSVAVARQTVVHLHLLSPFVQVTTEEGGTVRAQINPVFSYNAKGGVEEDRWELVFLADLPAMAVHKFTLRILGEGEVRQPEGTQFASVKCSGTTGESTIHRHFNGEQLSADATSISVHTTHMSTTHNGRTGMLEGVTTMKEGHEQQLNITFAVYSNTNSGPYLFQPTRPAVPLNMESNVVYTVQGPVLAAVHVFASLLHHSVTIFDTSDVLGQSLHLRNTVDLSNVDNEEWVMRLQSGLKPKEHAFYTDSNGLLLYKRHYSAKRNIETNYFPMPQSAMIADSESRMSVLADHPHGCTMPTDGELEVMLVRTARMDDRKGLGSMPDGRMSDAVATTSVFKVIFEQNPEGEDHVRCPIYYFHMMYQLPPHYAYLSPSAIALQTAILRRPLLFVHGAPPPPTFFASPSHRDMHAIPYITSMVDVPSSMPCDYEIVSLRAISETAAGRWLLVLHRHGVDCRVRSTGTPMSCEGDERNVNLFVRSLLGRLGVDTVSETDLSGVNVRHLPLPLADVHFEVQPSSFRTFTFSLK